MLLQWLSNSPILVCRLAVHHCLGNNLLRFFGLARFYFFDRRALHPFLTLLIRSRRLATRICRVHFGPQSQLVTGGPYRNRPPLLKVLVRNDHPSWADATTSSDARYVICCSVLRTLWSTVQCTFIWTLSNNPSTLLYPFTQHHHGSVKSHSVPPGLCVLNSWSHWSRQDPSFGLTKDYA